MSISSIREMGWVLIGSGPVGRSQRHRKNQRRAGRRRMPMRGIDANGARIARPVPGARTPSRLPGRPAATRPFPGICAAMTGSD
jgi:hypothetical protein